MFSFCYCPLCKQWVDVPAHERINKILAENKDLHDKIMKMARERLKFEELEKDPKLTSPDSPYF